MIFGIRDLKARLSAWLDRVDAGETIIVTDRGLPRAVITRIDPALDPVAQGLDAGWLSAGPAFGTPTPAGRHAFRARPGVRVADLLDADRGQ